MNVVNNPIVDIIGHSGHVQYPYDYESVVKAAGDNGKLIELNSGTFRGGRKAAKPKSPLNTLSTTQSLAGTSMGV